MILWIFHNPVKPRNDDPWLKALSWVVLVCEDMNDGGELFTWHLCLRIKRNICVWLLRVVKRKRPFLLINCGQVSQKKSVSLCRNNLNPFHTHASVDGLSLRLWADTREPRRVRDVQVTKNGNPSRDKTTSTLNVLGLSNGLLKTSEYYSNSFVAATRGRRRTRRNAFANHSRSWLVFYWPSNRQQQGRSERTDQVTSNYWHIKPFLDQFSSVKSLFLPLFVFHKEHLCGRLNYC